MIIPPFHILAADLVHASAQIIASPRLLLYKIMVVIQHAKTGCILIKK